MEKAKLIKKLIDEQGLNLKAFSEQAGVPYTTLRSILERGLDNTSVGNAIKICKALNITVEELEILSKQEHAGTDIIRENSAIYRTSRSNAQNTKIETIAAHLGDKELSDKKIELLKQYIDALFDEE